MKFVIKNSCETIFQIKTLCVFVQSKNLHCINSEFVSNFQTPTQRIKQQSLA